MIIKTITHSCTRCGSVNIRKHGHNKSGNAQFKCNDCGRSSVLKPKVKYSEERKEHIIKTYLERGSLRGMQRLFGVAPDTLIYRVLHFKFESKKPFSVIRRKSDLSEDLAFD